MASAMHESFAEHTKVEGPSERSFGLTVGGIFFAIGLFKWWRVSPPTTFTMIFLGVGLTLVVLGLVAPRTLAPLNRAWMKLGLLMAMVVNPIIMFLMFALIFVPTAIIMRIGGRDALRLKRDAKADSYWIDRKPPGPAPETMINQF